MDDKIFEKFLADLEPDNLPYPFNIIVEIVGPELLYKIVEELGGMTLYIPKMRTIFKGVMDEQIVKEFNGYNYLRLASKYGVSERTIRNIISKNKKSKAKR